MQPTQFLAALLPGAILLFVMWRRDNLQREPISMILRAFLLGMLAVPLSLCLSIPMTLVGEDLNLSVFLAKLYEAFCEAAIPEELAKILLLYLFLRKNKYFDEYMDGIVYAVAIGLGFATLENVFYIISKPEWGTLAITRAFTAIPGHFAFGVIMGYYFSLYRIEKASKCLIIAIIGPILAHGAYDSILFLISSGVMTGILVLVFFVFMIKICKYCKKLINHHLDTDRRVLDKPNLTLDKRE